MPPVFVNNSAQTWGGGSSVNSSSNASEWCFYNNQENENGSNTAYDHTTSLAYDWAVPVRRHQSCPSWEADGTG